MVSIKALIHLNMAFHLVVVMEHILLNLIFSFFNFSHKCLSRLYFLTLWPRVCRLFYSMLQKKKKIKENEITYSLFKSFFVSVPKLFIILLIVLSA
jgi:hypothetical protein